MTSDAYLRDFHFSIQIILNNSISIKVLVSHLDLPLITKTKSTELELTGIRSVLVGDRAEAPSLVCTHTRRRCDTEVVSARRCREGGDAGAEMDDGDRRGGAKASMSSRLSISDMPT